VLLGLSTVSTAGLARGETTSNSGASTVAVRSSPPGYAPTDIDYQRQVCLADGLYWVFYWDGGDYVYKTSPDGESWSSESVLATTNTGFSGEAAFYCDGNAFYYVASNGQDYPPGYSFFQYGYGSLTPSGTVDWTVSQLDVNTTGFNDDFPSLAVDTSGDVWVSVGTQTPAFGWQLEVWEHTTSWSQSLDEEFPGTSIPVSILVPLTDGKMAFLYQDGDGDGPMFVRTFSSGSWSAAVPTSGQSYILTFGSAVALNDTVALAVYGGPSAANPGGQIDYLTYSYGNASWASPTLVGSGIFAAIGSDGVRQLAISYGTGSSVFIVNSTDSGSSWSAPIEFSSSGLMQFITMSYSFPPAAGAPEVSVATSQPSYEGNATITISGKVGSNAQIGVLWSTISDSAPSTLRFSTATISDTNSALLNDTGVIVTTLTPGGGLADLGEAPVNPSTGQYSYSVVAGYGPWVNDNGYCTISVAWSGYGFSSTGAAAFYYKSS